MNETNSWQGGVRARKRVWFDVKGNRLDVTNKTTLNDEIPADVLAYLRRSVAEGVPARYGGPQQRVRAKPHSTSMENPGTNHGPMPSVAGVPGISTGYIPPCAPPPPYHRQYERD